MPDHTDDAPPTPSEDPTGEHLPLLELETILARPPSWRKRLAQISLVLVVSVVALVALHGTLFPSPPHFQPTPTLDLPSTILPALLVQSDVTYGTVTINGRKQSVSLPLVTALHGEIYDLTLTAPPFQPVSCHVISPAPPGAEESSVFSQQGHCRVIRYSSKIRPPTLSLHGVLADPSLVIEIDATTADLLPEQAHQVTSLLTSTLTTQQKTSVPPGAFIAKRIAPDGTITSTRASEPLGARAFLSPSTSFLPQAPSCGTLICPFGLSPYMYSDSSAFPTSPLWAVSVPMGLRWQFTHASGEVVSEVSFPAGSEIVVVLAYDAKQGWQLAQQEFVPGFESIPEQLPGVFCEVGALFLLLQPGYPAKSYASILHDQGVDGCALSLHQAPPNQPGNTVDLGHFVWRFGVLLTADDNAHALDPDLPRASPEEIAAAGG